MQRDKAAQKIARWRKGVRVSAAIALVLYLVLLFHLVFFSKVYGRGVGFRRYYNLIPFRTILDYLQDSHSFGVVVTNLLGNITAFVPLGFLIPLVFPRISSFWRVSGVVFLTTLGVEVIQYISAVGSFDVDDLILNLLGGVLGYGIYRLLMWVARFGKAWQQ